MTPQSSELDQLEKIRKQVRHILNDTRKNYAYPGSIPSDEYEEVLGSRILILVREAIIDELEKIPLKFSNYFTINTHVRDRLKQLENPSREEKHE